MLVVDRYPLGFINQLNFLDQIFLGSPKSADFQDFLDVQRTGGELGAGGNELSVFNPEFSGQRDQVFAFLDGFDRCVADADFVTSFGFGDFGFARYFCQRRNHFRRPGFK